MSRKADIQLLTQAQQARLVHCESVIERNFAAFYETGLALLEIRDERLYRATHATFEEYCREKWGWGRHYANKLIESSEVITNLDGIQIGDHGHQLPATERQARELARLKPEQQREAWQRAVETAPNGRITAEHIRETREFLNNPATWKYPHKYTPTNGSSLPHVAHNSGNNEWYTPQEYIEAARKVMGQIDLDPASSQLANTIVKATSYFTIEKDGLKKKWSGRVWMNPPYGTDLIGKFIKKLCQHFKNGEITEAIVLLNNASETEWFQTVGEIASAVCYPKGRIQFWSPDKASNSPLQGQAILYLGKRVNRFKSTFAPFGLIWILS